MPVAISLELDAHLAVVTYADPYSVTEWDRAMASLLSAPLFREACNILVDRTAASAPTRAFAEHIADFLDRHAPDFAGRRVAIVVRSPEAYGMGRMQEALNESATVRTRVFRDPAEARLWLRDREDR